VLEAPQPVRVKLETDQEEQEHDPEIGDVKHFLGGPDQPQSVRPHHRARNQIAEHSSQAEAAKQGDEQHRRAQHHHHVPEE
jgi:hypothetical protein